MATLSTTDNKFENDVIGSSIPVIVDFWAEWCGPCKEISPLLDEISNEMKNKIKIVKINIDENPNIPSQYGVQSIPTLIIFKKGEPVATKVGGSIKTDLISWINDSI